MKQTITELTIQSKIDDTTFEVLHDLDSIQFAMKEGEDRWVFFRIPAEFCDSLIEMLQKRKELMA
jgi:hypothetical protein